MSVKESTEIELTTEPSIPLNSSRTQQLPPSNQRDSIADSISTHEGKEVESELTTVEDTSSSRQGESQPTSVDQPSSKSSSITRRSVPRQEVALEPVSPTPDRTPTPATPCSE